MQEFGIPAICLLSRGFWETRHERSRKEPQIVQINRKPQISQIGTDGFLAPTLSERWNGELAIANSPSHRFHRLTQIKVLVFSAHIRPGRPNLASTRPNGAEKLLLHFKSSPTGASNPLNPCNLWPYSLNPCHLWPLFLKSVSSVALFLKSVSSVAPIP
jgi:hypothetical protein